MRHDPIISQALEVWDAGPRACAFCDIEGSENYVLHFPAHETERVVIYGICDRCNKQPRDVIIERAEKIVYNRLGIR